MLLLLQRVNFAKVMIDNQETAAIKGGLLVFLAIENDDNQIKAERLCERMLNYRIFPDQNDKMNLSVKDINGEVLIVSQFTLAADTSKGNRPSFSSALHPDQSKVLYDLFVSQAKTLHPKIATGVFGADMKIELCNDGPVTFLLKI
jgi:D-aminoacyl-tRNA deacylase